jgi:hypothetical protein
VAAGRLEDLPPVCGNLFNPGTQSADDVIHQVRGRAVRSEFRASFFCNQCIFVQVGERVRAGQAERAEPRNFPRGFPQRLRLSFRAGLDGENRSVMLGDLSTDAIEVLEVEAGKFE